MQSILARSLEMMRVLCTPNSGSILRNALGRAGQLFPCVMAFFCSGLLAAHFFPSPF